MIKVTDLRKKLGGKEVLRGIDLEVAEGELVVIIGGSGMGKSVLLKHIIGFMKPDSGGVMMDSCSVVSCTRRELYQYRQNCGFVFQSAALLQSITIGENVALPLVEHTHLSPKEIREIARERLHRVKLFNQEDKLPSELSGGMQKRASIARALVMDPKILLFDEPTSGLDPVLAATIGELIVDLHARIGFTAIAVSHNMRFAYRIADRIGMLSHGRIIEIGTPEEIRRSSKPMVQNFIHGRPEKSSPELN